MRTPREILDETIAQVERSQRARWHHDCSCGQSYSAAAWAGLHYVGDQPTDHGDYELRDCVCGSTMMAMPPMPRGTP